MTRLAFLVSLALLVGIDGAAAQPTLKAAATVASDVIRLGDLFSDAGPHADDVVAPAPPPGSRTIFNAQWLATTASEHQLDWEPQSRFEQASVERATRVIGTDAVISRLLDEIGRRQSIDGAQLELDDPGFRLVVAKEASDAIAVDGLTIDPRSGRFSALVQAPAEDAAAEQQRVTGRLIRMVHLPTLTHALAPGETIAAGDIEIMPLRADRVGADVILEPRELIGKTPRRALRAHEPLHSADVQVPIVVHKGDLVTIVLETRAMRLTTQGKALDDGGLGAAIRVANTKSGRVIDAAVVAGNLVTVAAPAQLAVR
ncbi:MAG TPA: flagellar basal body P-ring formation chaperone FlgA [Stellaceae bacterium]|nr:flagellar basal body P-ring formation chaperone FlgA [Stellaceae bacterium]